jgi:Spy/CpxP family protein refolding chaperone
MKTKIMILVISLSFVTILLAQKFNRPNNNFQNNNYGYCLNNLNLSTEQKDAITKLQTQHQNEMIDFRSQIDKINLQIQNERMKLNPDGNKIKNLITQRNEIKTKMDLARESHRQSVYNLLTDEQKQNFYNNRPIGLGMGKGNRPGRGANGCRW